MNYYNEIDPKLCAWIQELINEKLIPDGKIDCRSIADVQPGDLAGFTQCHFFTGIAGWSLTLHLAGWPDDREIWSGSCPCQPFSCAGKGKGTADERHLWPEFYRLIRECRPAICIGEQVASAAGRDWLSGVRADLETLAYEVGAADLCAASVQAPHIRQRLFWVANTISDGFGSRGASTPRQAIRGTLIDNGITESRLANAESRGLGTDRSAPGSAGHAEQREQVERLANPELARRQATGSGPEFNPGRESQPGQSPCGVGDTTEHGCEVRPHLHGEHGREGSGQGCEPDHRGVGDTVRNGSQAGLSGQEPWQEGIARIADNSGREFLGWGNTWHPCSDGKARRIPPESQSVLQLMAHGLPETMDPVSTASLGFPLALKVPNRTTLLKGYGNSINAPLAAEFVKAVMDVTLHPR